MSSQDLFHVLKFLIHSHFYVGILIDMQFPNMTAKTWIGQLCETFEAVLFSIKKQLAGWSSLGSTQAWNVSSRLQYNTPASEPLPTLIAPTNLNEMCCCVDSRRRWPLSWSKHLSEIGWNWYNSGRGIITPAWDRHETSSVFVLPISLGLGVLSSCFFDSSSRVFFLFSSPVLFIWFLCWIWTDSLWRQSSHCEDSEEDS